MVSQWSSSYTIWKQNACNKLCPISYKTVPYCCGKVQRNGDEIYFTFTQMSDLFKKLELWHLQCFCHFTFTWMFDLFIETTHKIWVCLTVFCLITTKSHNYQMPVGNILSQLWMAKVQFQGTCYSTKLHKH